MARLPQVQQPNFQMLAQLPTMYAQGQEIGRERDMRDARSGALAKFNGSNYGDLAQSLFAAGDFEGGMQAAIMADKQKPDLVKTWEYFGGAGGSGGSGAAPGGAAGGVPRNMPGSVADKFKSGAQLAAEKKAAEGQIESGLEATKRQQVWPRVKGQLERLRNILTMPEGDKPGAKTRFNTEDFEWGLGPTVGDEQGGYGSAMARKFSAAVEPMMSDTARGVELRDTILGEANTALKLIQPLVRTKGEGSQSDAEFKVISDMVGNLTKSRTPEEYQRRVNDIEGRIQNLLGTLESEPDVMGGAGQDFDPDTVIDNGDGTGTLPDGRKVRWVE